MTNDDLNAISERFYRATPGPWISRAVTDPKDTGCGYWVVHMPVAHNTQHRLWFGELSENSEEDIANANFIASSRTDVPDLIATVRDRDAEIVRLTKERNRAVEKNADLVRHHNILVAENRQQSATITRLRAELAEREAEPDAVPSVLIGPRRRVFTKGVMGTYNPEQWPGATASDADLAVLAARNDVVEKAKTIRPFINVKLDLIPYVDERVFDARLQEFVAAVDALAAAEGERGGE